jgi:hypothetical protein
LTAVDSRPDGVGRKVVLVMDRVDPELVKAVREGTYVVDPRLVAGAILQRREQRSEAQRLAGMLEAGEQDGGSIGGSDGHAGPAADVA